MTPDVVAFLFAAVALWCVSVFILLRELRQGSFSMLFWIGILAVYLIPCVFDPFAADSLDWDWLLITVPDEVGTYTRAAVFATAFNICYVLVRRYRHHFHGPALAGQLSGGQELAAYALLCGGFVFSVLSVSITSSLGSAFSRTYGSFYEGRISLLSMIGSYMFLSASGAMCIAFFRRRFDVLVILAGVVLLTYGLAQERKLIVACAAPFAVWYLFAWYKSAGPVSTAILFAKTVGLLLLCFYGLVFIQIVRYQGNFFSHGIPAVMDGVVVEQFGDAVARGKSESPARWGYYYFMEPQVRIDDQFTGRTYRRLALLPIPTSLIPDIKPRDYTEAYYSNVFDDKKYGAWDYQPGTHHPLIYGDAYVNFGWWGVLLGGFWAVVFNLVDRLLRRTSPFVQFGWIGPLGISAMMLARGSIYNSVALCYYSFVFIAGVAFIIRAGPFVSRQAADDEVEEEFVDDDEPITISVGQESTRRRAA